MEATTRLWEECYLFAIMNFCGGGWFCGCRVYFLSPWLLVPLSFSLLPLTISPSLPPCPCLSPPLSLSLSLDLNNSSSTLASSDGDSDSKNEDTLSSLDNPLPNGMDQNSRDKNKQEAGIKGSDNCTSGSGTASGSGSLGSKAKKTQTSEIATISLRLVLPGVPQPVEVTVHGSILTSSAW